MTARNFDQETTNTSSNHQSFMLGINEGLLIVVVIIVLLLSQEYPVIGTASAMPS